MPHSAAQGRRARSSADLVGVVGGVGVGVGAGGGIGAGAGADEDLKAAVLGAGHGAGGSRPTAVSVRQSVDQLCSAGARAPVRFWSLGAEQDGSGQWMAALLLLCWLVRLRLCLCNSPRRF